MSSKNNTWLGRWAADLPWWPVIQTSPTNCCHPLAPPPSPGSRRQGWPYGRGDTPPLSPSLLSRLGSATPGTTTGKRGRNQVIRLVLTVEAGGARCSAPGWQQQTPVSVPFPATVPRICSSHSDPQLRLSKNPLRAGAPAALGVPEAIADPPLPGITAGRELHPKPISPSPTFPPARLIPRRDAAVKPL